jgi:hypothetical protein
VFSRFLAIGVVAALSHDPSSCGIHPGSGGAAYAPCNRSADCEKGEYCHAGVCLLGDASDGDDDHDAGDGGSGHG